MNSSRERCIELLADRATHDLDDRRRRELNAILDAHPEWDDDGYELATAVLDLLVEASPTTMPDAVRQRLAGTALSWIDGSRERR